MKLAVFLPNWIGDVVMATPALRALRQHFPHARLIAVQRPYVAGVLEGNPWFDQVVHLQPGPWAGLRAVPLLRRLRIDLALLLTNSFRTALVAWLAGCSRRVGFARDGRAALLTERLQPLRDQAGRFVPSPVIDSYNALAKAVGCAAPGYRQELFTSPADEAHADRVWRHLRLEGSWPVVLLNPGAAFGAAKLWPKESFAELARRLATQIRAKVLVLCGPAERELAAWIANQARHDFVGSLAEEPPSLGLLKACVRRANLLVTTDSGPRHFAAAFHRPVVTLFGPTHTEWTETYHPLAMHLQRPVPCGPCQQRVCPEGHHRCMTELSVEEVFTAACQLLEAAGARVHPLTTPLGLPLRKGA